MKQYIQYEIHESDIQKQEVIIACLDQWSFDGYEQKETSLLAYGDNENVNREAVETYFEKNNINYTKDDLAEQNWNTDWEKSFTPVLVKDFCGIRASFHPPIKNVAFEIIITPKMSFGTGHHATTQLVIELMRTINFKGKKIIDFGTGTGILAILAEKMTAEEIIAIDNDNWCIENAKENVETNLCKKIKIIKADNLNALPLADIILANINTNTILDNFNNLSHLLKPKGELIVSGFLNQDKNKIIDIATSYNLKINKAAEKNNWLAIEFQHIY